jgi:hypothetical protein
MESSGMLNGTDNIYGILSESFKELKQICKNIFRALNKGALKMNQNQDQSGWTKIYYRCTIPSLNEICIVLMGSYGKVERQT